MKKRFDNYGERLLAFAIWFRTKRLPSVLTQTLQLLFPFVWFSATTSFLVNGFIQPAGFFNRIFHLSTVIPALDHFQSFATILNATTGRLVAVIAAYASARLLAKSYQRAGSVAGVTSAIAFLTLNFNFSNLSQPQTNALPPFNTANLGMRGLFFALVVGCLVGWLFGHWPQKATTEMPMLARSLAVIIPFSLTILVTTVLAVLLSKVAPNGLNSLFYRLFQFSLTKAGHNFIAILLLILINNFLWGIGISGPLNPQNGGSGSSEMLANLDKVLTAHSMSQLPYPINGYSIYNAFASFGGNGMMLGLLIALLIRSRHQNTRSVAKLSVVPSITNINQPLLVGLPIILNPIFMIPFIVAPIVSSTIGYVCIQLRLIPPSVYSLPWTTPGPLFAFLGSGGAWSALVVSLLCLGSATLVYLPFVKLNDRLLEATT